MLEIVLLFYQLVYNVCHLVSPGPASYAHGGGYPRVRPTIPFNNEDARGGNSLGFSPWQQNNYMGKWARYLGTFSKSIMWESLLKFTLKSWSTVIKY